MNKDQLEQAIVSAKQDVLKRFEKTFPIETSNCAAVIDEFVEELRKKLGST